MQTLESPTAPATLTAVPSFKDVPELTVRELQVVTLLVEGLTNAEIGGRLYLSPRTVQSHLATAMDALGVRTRTGLAVGALRAGIVPLFPPARRAAPEARGGLRRVA
ncbi:LuxR C-terminal-related transcriptional regulator [Patulibacter minatonensis]|uniref:LuxR C-terminal-related transcriptional regulator n=1 Tax=Patulibacter minatonensis TaxID=298163 RepID=UPI00047B02A8|nr:LuxR C-terminal-related transcriptional regulator [Patulibacter minatonensis]